MSAEQILSNWLFFLKLLGCVVGILYIAARVIEDIETIRAIRLAKKWRKPNVDAQRRQQLNAVVYGRFGR